MTAYPSTPPAPVLTQRRLAVQLHPLVRGLVAFGAVVAFGYAGTIGWRTNANGVVVAAAFAVGFLFAVFALAGVVPSHIKVGDVEVQLQQAWESGAGKGRVEGLTAGTELSKGVATGDLPVGQVEEAVYAALTSPESLRIDGIDLPIAQLAPAAAGTQTRAVAQALTTVAKHAGQPS